MTTIGSLFTGYGGLDMAARMALDPEARVAWTSDIEQGPCRLAPAPTVPPAREQQLRLLGNGGDPQQGAAAIYQLTTFALKEAA